MAKRRLPRYQPDYVIVLLMCGCQMAASVTAVFERKTFRCPWSDHGEQDWLRFDPATRGYSFECRDAACTVSRHYEDRLVLCLSGARSHSRLHGHRVRVLCGEFVGLKIVPALVDVDLPPF